MNIRLFLNTIRTKALAVWTGIGSIANRGFASSLNAVRNSALGATLATRGFSLAILNIPVLGWIVAAIMAIVGAFILLWEHSRKFRKILFGIWEVAKATFHNIGVYATRLWGMVLKPIATAYWNLYKWIFSKVWEIAKMAWKGITSAISWAWNSVIKPVAGFIFNVYKRAFVTIWNVVKMVFNWIVNLISKVWNWIKTTFSEFASWLQTTLIDPIYEAFSKVWDWLNNLFGGIVDKLGSLAQPIKDLWNSIFSSEGTINVKTAYEKGEKKGGESFDRDQKAKQGKSDKPQEVKVVDDQSHKNIFDVGQGLKGSTGTIGGVAAEKTKKKKGRKGSGDGESDGGNKVRNLTVGKMVENLNIYTQKGTVGESKEQILQAIKEIFGTAVSDFAGADRHATTA